MYKWTTPQPKCCDILANCVLDSIRGPDDGGQQGRGTQIRCPSCKDDQLLCSSKVTSYFVIRSANGRERWSKCISCCRLLLANEALWSCCRAGCKFLFPSCFLWWNDGTKIFRLGNPGTLVLAFQKIIKLWVQGLDAMAGKYACPAMGLSCSEGNKNCSRSRDAVYQQCINTYFVRDIVEGLV